MNAVALFVSKNTSTALPSGGLDSLFFPSVFQEKPLIEGLFLAFHLIRLADTGEQRCRTLYTYAT
ncbi:hypothetical protein ACRU2E_09475 [Providencia stuartii]|uniref:hypothetical protein n=1 Tax=Providencia stuartii TaxID=588 RepID=UPI0018A751BE|nr:hypothetical protein [Providencia stuartii]